MELKTLTKEQIEEIKKCKTHEEGLKLIRKAGIEVSDDELENLAGGKYEGCEYDHHDFYRTGEFRPNKYLGDWWSDEKIVCRYCYKVKWSTFAGIEDE